MSRFGFVRAALPAVLIATILIPEPAEGIPAFARRYKVSCTTCHQPIPRLTEYGEEFAGNGFIILEEEKDRDYVSAGDDLLWLNRDFPLAARFDAFGVWREETKAETDLQTPWGIKLLSGGALYRNIGYYFYFYMSERGEVAGIEDAYVHFNDVGGSALDIMVGQFQTSDPLMKRELRLTFEDYEIYRTRVGESGTNLTYDRGVMMTYGVEASGTDFAAFVVNGNGKGEADEHRQFDDDKYKNGGFRVMQGIGEYASVGAYVYYGKEAVIDTTLSCGCAESEITYWGPDVHVAAGPVAFTGQYLMRKDTNPLFLDQGSDVETEGIVAELVLTLDPEEARFFLTGLYNRVDSDRNEYDYETASLNLSYVLARNIRLMGEYTRDLEYERNRALAGFVSAF